MSKQLLRPKYLLSLSLLTILWATGFATAQTTPNTVAPVPPVTNPDITWRQVAVFDDFLDHHPEVADQLQKDPSLVDNQDFVKDHPALQDFLRDHPEIREEIKESPSAFMHREDRYEQHEGDADRRGDRDITRGELANMDHFFDRHPEIAEQLQKDPSLIDNRKFVENHPALKDFLADHPELRTAFDKNPNAFMHRDERFDGGVDPTRPQLASLDRFLDDHPEIAEQLRKDPSLVDNKKFVADHPALQAYLQQHSDLRQEIDAHPDAFMRQEDRFDRREDRREDHGELASFHQFLGDHSTIASQLTKNPELAKNDEYMQGHPELQQYLRAHPGVQQQLAQNPQTFMKSAQQFEGTPTAQPKPASPKAPALDPTKPKL
jgi:hypothetical protein